MSCVGCFEFEVAWIQEDLRTFLQYAFVTLRTYLTDSCASCVLITRRRSHRPGELPLQTRCTRRPSPVSLVARPRVTAGRSLHRRLDDVHDLDPLLAALPRHAAHDALREALVGTNAALVLVVVVLAAGALARALLGRHRGGHRPAHARALGVGEREGDRGELRGSDADLPAAFRSILGDNPPLSSALTNPYRCSPHAVKIYPDRGPRSG